MKILLSILFVLFGTTGFYDFQFTSMTGEVISMSQFSGKKILIVNTSSDSLFMNQYATLEELYQQNKDSLVIIAFPSNSFGHETDDDNTINNTVMSQYNIHYILANKTEVTGANMSPLFHWLTTADENGTMNMAVRGDFQKFLIDAQGNLTGVFAGAVDPMSDDITSLLH